MSLDTLLDRKTSYFDAQGQKVIPAFILLDNCCKAINHHHWQSVITNQFGM